MDAKALAGRLLAELGARTGPGRGVTGIADVAGRAARAPATGSGASAATDLARRLARFRAHTPGPESQADPLPHRAQLGVELAQRLAAALDGEVVDAPLRALRPGGRRDP